MTNFLTFAEASILEGNSAFNGIFLVRKIVEKTASTGNPFFDVELGDKTGNFVAKIWAGTPAFSFFQDVKIGAVVEISGTTSFFNEKFAPKISRAIELSEEEIDAGNLLENLVEKSPENFDELCAELESHVEAIAHEPLRILVRDVFEKYGKVFKTSVAAKTMHQAYRHGLLEHSCHLARIARALFPIFPQIDQSLALAGALLHDIGKIEEYTQGFTGTEKTRAGILQGHLVLGYKIVRGLAKKMNQEKEKPTISPEILERLEHLVLSHQGKLEWGSPILPATPEAIFISMVDDFDAKMAMVQKALRDAGTKEFSEPIFGLDKRQILLTPPFPRASEAGIDPAGTRKN